MQTAYSVTSPSSNYQRPVWGLATDRTANANPIITASSGILPTAAACVMMMFTNITGSSPSTETSYNRNTQVLSRYSSVRKTDDVDDVLVVARVAEVETIAEQVSSLKTAFGLNTSDIAKLMNVSRPTIYSWMKGTVPTAEAMIQLQHLSDSGKVFKAQNITRPDILIKRPIFEGKTAFDILQETKALSPEQVAMMRAIDLREQASRLNTSKGGHRQLRDAAAVIDDVADSISL